MQPLSPQQALEKATETGCRKANLTSEFSARGIAKMTIAGAMAGAYIALGGLLALLVGQGFPEISAGNPGLAKLLSGAMFPVGLILVVFLGAELFTGNNALLIPGWRERRITAPKVLINWVVIYLTNFIGAILFTAAIAWYSGATDAAIYRDAAINIATAKVNMPWLVVMVRGIGANWLVCLAIWLGITCPTPFARIVALWMPVMAFVVMGMEHSIANMFYLPLGMLHGADITIGCAICNNLIPATIGNIIGGAIFVAMPFHILHRK